MRRNEVYIFGHKNPDTDSICSAIACAYLKNQIAKKKKGDNNLLYTEGINADATYIPKRAGVINPETEYVLERFGVPAPSFMPDVRCQVRDIDIRKVEGVHKKTSLKQAWMRMRSVNVATLPVLSDDGTMEGIITIGDIARAYMAVFDNSILSVSKTPYDNILDALNGTIIVGDSNRSVENGKIFIAAANIDVMQDHIQPQDVVILGNRYETQLFAVERGVSCIIVCEGAPISKTIRKIAEDKGCAVISSPHDTYTVARLITQSVPVDYFMTSDKIVSFRRRAFIDDIKGIMTKMRHRDFPIVSRQNKFVGMISRRSLLNMPAKQLILVDHNEPDQAVDGLDDAEVIEIIDHHKLGTVETIRPVNVRNQPVGCTATIIYQMFIENDIDIPENMAGLLCSAILSDTLLFRSPTCTEIDKDAAQDLARIAKVSPENLAEEMFRAGGNMDKKAPEEIFYQDYKKFISNGVTFGISQVLVMSKDERTKAMRKISSFVETARKEKVVDMMFLMLTNIIEESTLVYFEGPKAKEVVEESFDETVKGQTIELPGVVSRKKQFIPPIMATLQQ